MKNDKKLVGIGFLIIVLFLLSCKKDSTDIDPLILGRWGKNYNPSSGGHYKQVIIFKSNGKFDAGSGTDTVTPFTDYGTFSTINNEITIIDGNNPYACDSVVGIYYYSIINDTLQFVCKSDWCYSRSQSLPGKWKREN
jgi:hypothetical protein